MAAEVIGRADFLAQLGAEWRPGDHLSCLGPTGRGKSTLIGELIPRATRHDVVAVLSPKGADPAYAALGHPTRVWPPRRHWTEQLGILITGHDRHEEDPGPLVWRVEVPIRKPEDFIALRGLYSTVLHSILARPENVKTSLMVVVDDSRFVCDPRSMRLEAPVRNGLIIGRSKKVTMVNNFQAPRWVPREGLDQVTHVLIWRNRDRDVAKRLTEISGSIDPREIEAAILNLGYHDHLWVDGRADEWRIVKGS